MEKHSKPTKYAAPAGGKRRQHLHDKDSMKEKRKQSNAEALGIAPVEEESFMDLMKTELLTLKANRTKIRYANTYRLESYNKFQDYVVRNKAQEILTDDTEENSNDSSQPSKRRRMGSGDSSRSCETSSQDLGFSYFPAENLIEYKWPPDETGEYYMLQEQVSEYLGVTSFKRKYPDLERRDLSHKEKLYLRELNVITETQCTLGLTALRSDEVIDLMIKEYPAKHAEYSVILQEKERQRITDHYKEYSQMQQQNTQKVEASKVPEYIKKAAKKAAEFNSNLNRERMEERRAYFDLQTHIIQVPQGKYKILPTERTKVSPYPVALIPGQFQEYYKRYSPDELRYLPLNTALYEPPLDPELPALDSDGDSDDAEEGRGDEKRKTKGNSDNSSGNVSEGDCATDNQEDSFQGRQKTREKSATPRKDGSKRSVLSKSVPGYKELTRKYANYEDLDCGTIHIFLYM
ncbi:PHD finger protein 10 isoform X4 [Apteryx rowi]|uniref:PHD finger protein 10 isoform X4 n=1 Tax=Apteryx rowi TaxID=308060 RepID=UPI000E1CAF21|nr:PHD finger protein 10 isoform X4 [Apteryx rowi]